MSSFGRSPHTLDDLFVHGLKTIYYAERQVAETLPNMIVMATSRCSYVEKSLRLHSLS